MVRPHPTVASAPLDKRFKSSPFQGEDRGFESRTGYKENRMISIANCYDFYKMTEDERIALVGEILVEHRGSERAPYNILYFPVWLADTQFNYDKQQGLIAVYPVAYYKGHNMPKSVFGIHAISPDDLDCDLNFRDAECALYDAVVAFLTSMDKVNVTYGGVITAVHEHFHAGEIYM